MNKKLADGLITPITGEWSASWDPGHYDPAIEKLIGIKEGHLLEFVQSDGRVIQGRATKVTRTIHGVIFEFNIEGR